MPQPPATLFKPFYIPTAPQPPAKPPECLRSSMFVRLPGHCTLILMAFIGVEFWLNSIERFETTKKSSSKKEGKSSTNGSVKEKMSEGCLRELQENPSCGCYKGTLIERAAREPYVRFGVNTLITCLFFWKKWN